MGMELPPGHHSNLDENGWVACVCSNDEGSHLKKNQKELMAHYNYKNIKNIHSI